MAERISRNPLELMSQLNQASIAVLGEPNWPAAAPTSAALGARAFAIQVKINNIAAAEAALLNARAELESEVSGGRDEMKQVDDATSLLYTPQGPQKANFGVPPKQPTGPSGGAPPPPSPPVIFSIKDGTGVGAIFLDWTLIPGGAYEVEWHTDGLFTNRVGNQTVTQSELNVTNLTPGTQYWFRVRAIKASVPGNWSDPATRIAPL